MVITRPRRTGLVWAVSLAALVLVTAGLLAVRSELQEAHVVLVYLLIVLIGSAYGGRALGLVLAILGFLLIDYFFQSPYDLLSVASRLDWFVLAAFVITAGVAANLLAQAQTAAARAQRRTDEVARLSRLGAELLGTGTAENALAAIAERVRETMNAETSAVFRSVGSTGEPELERLVVCGNGSAIDQAHAMTAALHGAIVAITSGGNAVHLTSADGATAVGSPEGSQDPIRALIIPLRVHDRIVGVLGVSGGTQMRVDEGSRRLLDALSYYAALAVERVTLVAQAEHAEALRESDRVREALLASVSHDLRTPLSTIKVLAQDSVARGDLEVAMGNAVVIEEQADRLSRIVNNLLDMTRLRGSAFPVRPDVNAAEDLVGAVARQVTGILGDHRLVREIDQAGPVLLGRFDFVQSQRILVNLIENGVRYSPPRTPVVLNAWRQDDSLVFSVSDSGRGVPPSERERIFEAFYRTRSSSADLGGVGLGLYIARALAEAQGGTLNYVCRPVAGSCFVLRLPAVDGEPSDTEAESFEGAS